MDDTRNIRRVRQHQVQDVLHSALHSVPILRNVNNFFLVREELSYTLLISA